uniref:Uncharacterized protein n=1 Tax=Mucochytrium quahogii TaxID=96639 RepID=A0A7S2WGK4_9STRA|mmetsp:Transcript_25498/g.41140  ORF Transcript_25498/g.41140 Transcript_25498/m.41140 type:complete len:605 (-) Transcript_25498:1814-3628(-)
MDALKDGVFDVDKAKSMTKEMHAANQSSNGEAMLDLCDVEEIKSNANKAFKEKRYEKALQEYSKGVDLARKNYESFVGGGESSRLIGVWREKLCIFLTNRSNVEFNQKKYEESLRDADEAISLDKQWNKGYFRRATALFELGRIDEAMRTYEDAITNCEDKEFFQMLLRKLKSHAKKKKRQAKAMPELYPEAPTAPKNEAEALFQTAERNIKRLREKLTNGSGSLDNDALVDGLFSRLLEPKSFREIVYHSTEVPNDETKKYLPSSFQELVSNEIYFEALVALFPKIKAKAKSVLDNVKSKAAKEGQFMDAATERMLTPQVLNEAFAHQVVDMIHDINRKQNVAFAQASELLASPDDESASYDQLAKEALVDFGSNRGFGVVDNFLNDVDGEWRELFLADAEDLFQTGKLEPRDVSSSSKRDMLKQPSGISKDYSGCWSCWLKMSECEGDYAALHELFQRMEALPFEMNKKVDGLDLRKPVSNNILLFAVGPVGGASTVNEFAGRAARLDGMFGEHNNGYKVSVTYCVGSADWTPGQGGEFRLRDISENETNLTNVDPAPDRLVIWKSRRTQNQISPLVSKTPGVMLYISMYFNGPADETNRKW